MGRNYQYPRDRTKTVSDAAPDLFEMVNSWRNAGGSSELPEEGLSHQQQAMVVDRSELSHTDWLDWNPLEVVIVGPGSGQMNGATVHLRWQKRSKIKELHICKSARWSSVSIAELS